MSHAPFWILFNPAVLEAVRVVEGAFLKADGKPTQFLFNTHRATGWWSGCRGSGTCRGSTASGVLATVCFRARAAGESDAALPLVESARRREPAACRRITWAGGSTVP